MGTDIHGVFQRRNEDGKWVDVPSVYDQSRHYMLFAILAGVRNGTGFAGVPTHTPLQPIAQPRGLPSDFPVDGDDHPIKDLSIMDPRRRKWHEEGEPLVIWMGDHSHSWLLGAEILAYADEHNKNEIDSVGVIPLVEYKAWDKKSPPPDGWAGEVAGREVFVATSPEMIDKKTTHVRVKWKTKPLSEIEYFVAEVRRLVGEHGAIRFVFGFDS